MTFSKTKNATQFMRTALLTTALLMGASHYACASTATQSVASDAIVVTDGALTVADGDTFVKTGAGTLILNGDSSATLVANSNLRVDAGTLQITDEANSLGSTRLVLADGATLSAGNDGASSVTFTPTNTIQFGNNPGNPASIILDASGYIVPATGTPDTRDSLMLDLTGVTFAKSSSSLTLTKRNNGFVKLPISTTNITNTLIVEGGYVEIASAGAPTTNTTLTSVIIRGNAFLSADAIGDTLTLTNCIVDIEDPSVTALFTTADGVANDPATDFVNYLATKFQKDSSNSVNISRLRINGYDYSNYLPDGTSATFLSADTYGLNVTTHGSVNSFPSVSGTATVNVGDSTITVTNAMSLAEDLEISGSSGVLKLDGGFTSTDVGGFALPKTITMAGTTKLDITNIDNDATTIDWSKLTIAHAATSSGVSTANMVTDSGALFNKAAGDGTFRLLLAGVTMNGASTPFPYWDTTAPHTTLATRHIISSNTEIAYYKNDLLDAAVKANPGEGVSSILSDYNYNADPVRVGETYTYQGPTENSHATNRTTGFMRGGALADDITLSDALFSDAVTYELNAAITGTGSEITLPKGQTGTVSTQYGISQDITLNSSNVLRTHTTDGVALSGTVTAYTGSTIRVDSNTTIGTLTTAVVT